MGNDVTKAGILGALIVARSSHIGAGTKLQAQLPNSASVVRTRCTVFWVMDRD